MRLLTLLAVSLFIMSCNNSAKPKEGTKDTAQTIKRMPETPAIPDTVFTGFGNEPFWSVYVIKDSKIVFHPADDPDTEVPYVTATTPANNITQYISVSENISIELTIAKKGCSDGMSETIHPYEVSLLVNKIKYSGCGRDGK
ncbi:MAG TPA: hypothetical protein VGO58_15540 [Chitinophagaceae bacterium]|jgi:uncharacterized membrane protein|nr:hypothetical protein [Chitinophagaceae bacterium]